MPSLAEVQSQIKNLSGVGALLGRKEIKELPSILWEDEIIEKLVQGLYNSRNGILVATNKRLIFVDKGLIYGLKVEDFPYDKISSIQYETGMLLGKITIFTSGNRADISHIQKNLAADFSGYVRARISSPKEHASVPKIDSGDTISKLERLAILQEKGILSEEEFLAEKKKILSQ